VHYRPAVRHAATRSTATAVGAGIRATVRSLTALDFQYGGGHTRKPLLVYAAAADAAEVLGWSAYDAGHHGAAQRYFTQGLRLARDGGDALTGGRILANLSHQANYLGNYNEAVHFARAAQSAIVGLSRSSAVPPPVSGHDAGGVHALGDVEHEQQPVFSFVCAGDQCP
jgi:hypothetical protein